MARPISIGPAASEAAALATATRARPSSATDAASQVAPFEHVLNDRRQAQDLAVDSDGPAQDTKLADEERAGPDDTITGADGNSTPSPDLPDDLTDNSQSPATEKGGSAPEPAGDPALQQALGLVLNAGSPGPQVIGSAAGPASGLPASGAGDLNIAAEEMVNPAEPVGQAIPAGPGASDPSIAASSTPGQTGSADPAGPAAMPADTDPPGQADRADPAVPATPAVPAAGPAMPGQAERATPAVPARPAAGTAPPGQAIAADPATRATPASGSNPLDQSATVDPAAPAAPASGSNPLDQYATVDPAAPAAPATGSTAPGQTEEVNSASPAAPAAQGATADAAERTEPAGRVPEVQGLLQNSAARKSTGLNLTQAAPAGATGPATSATGTNETGESPAAAIVSDGSSGDKPGRTAGDDKPEAGGKPSPAAKPAVIRDAAQTVTGDVSRVDPAQTATARSDAAVVIQPQNDGSPGFTLRVSGTANAPQGQQLPAAAFAFQIARQVARGENRFEIRLDPPELGRIDVRLHVSTDGRVNAHLTVERNEALDLLQRDARHLERALGDAGLKAGNGSLSFSLRDQGSAGFARDGETAPPSALIASSEETGDAAATSPQTILSGHIRADSVDIRV